MKNNVNITTYAAANLSTISATAEAKRKAEDAYKAAKKQVVKDLAQFLTENPTAVVLNKDMARMAGINPGHMASIVQSEGYNLGIASDSVVVTKQFAEIDESGQLVPNGTIRTETKSLCAFTKRKASRW